jgi:predicted dienelactone hydrolase
VAPTTDADRRLARRRLTLGVIGVVAIVAVVAVVAVVTDALSSRVVPVARPAARPTGSTRPTSTTVPARPPYPVGTLSFTVTEAATAGTGPRSFVTYVRYPAETGTGSPGGGAATPLRAGGPFPLVVFSGGYAFDPEGYSTLLDAWAAAGYVVADPVYPSTSPTSPQPLDESDIVHHPGDLSAVITALVQAGRGSGAGPVAALAGAVDTSSIAAIGHSDGGDVTLAASVGSCCRDPRIDAAVILSGAELAAFGGTYFSSPDLPLLVVQGTDDDINPPGCSVQLYDQAPPPKYYLSMLGQSHQSPYLQPGTALDTVQQVVVDFLDATLRGSGPARAAISRDGDVPGSSSLFAGSPPDLAAGPCPGAPGY